MPGLVPGRSPADGCTAGQLPNHSQGGMLLHRTAGGVQVLVFKALHILSMFAAVTFLIGEALAYAAAISRGDVAALASIRRLLGGRPIAGVAFLLLGIVFGLLTALTGDLDFFAGWLIAAYVLIVLLFAVNGSPWVQRLPRLGEEAMEAVAGQRSADDVRQSMAASRTATLVVVALNVLLFAAIIADMVLKPL
ncbi:MAG TPA: hypothetical protein VFY43_05645 [Candidatus Limnocylindria bacterium]|nr:hypothetical protein [Candidatus Limnocylindria bacterium]